jgi:hypothetical protein
MNDDHVNKIILNSIFIEPWIAGHSASLFHGFFYFRRKTMKKVSAQPVSKSKSTSEPNQSIRILYSGACPKLTNRGKGDLSYELGIDDTGESHVRIGANASSGAFSYEYVDVTRIKVLCGSHG